MKDARFAAHQTVNLLTSHTVDPTIPGSPFDSTPSTFDSQLFVEVLLQGTLFPGNGSHLGEVKSPLGGEMRLRSDFAISRFLVTLLIMESNSVKDMSIHHFTPFYITLHPIWFPD